MTYEDIERMSTEDAKEVIEELLVIAAAVSFLGALGVAVKIPRNLAHAASKFKLF